MQPSADTSNIPQKGAKHPVTSCTGPSCITLLVWAMFLSLSCGLLPLTLLQIVVEARISRRLVPWLDDSGRISKEAALTRNAYHG